MLCCMRRGGCPAIRTPGTLLLSENGKNINANTTVAACHCCAQLLERQCCLPSAEGEAGKKWGRQPLGPSEPRGDSQNGPAAPPSGHAHPSTRSCPPGSLCQLCSGSEMASRHPGLPAKPPEVVAGQGSHPRPGGTEMSCELPGASETWWKCSCPPCGQPASSAEVSWSGLTCSR